MTLVEILDGIVNYYERTYNIQFDRDKYNHENPYDITEWLWDFQGVYDDNRDWCNYRKVKLENNLDGIFKTLGYNDISIIDTYLQRLDISHRQENHYFFSYKHYNDYADTELAFVGFFR